jgi:predicted MFS family arabinose efflux permease
VLLAVNRIVRILGYGWVSTLASRLGGRRLTMWACLAAALSTIGYGLTTGFLLLLIARLVWGAAYGVINLTNMAYAYGEGKGAGSRLGIARGVSTLGPVLALAAGGWLVNEVGPQHTFTIYGAIGLLAVPLALQLPSLSQNAAPKREEAEHRWRVNPLNVLFFVVALAADGIFTATLSLLLSEITTLAQAVIGAGLLLAAQRLVGVLLSFCSGPVVDRVGAQRLLAPATLAIAAGLAALAGGAIYAGAVILVCARPIIGVVGPIMAVQRSPGDQINALASYATWSDTGLALGPLIGVLALAWIGFPATYALGTVLVLAALAWQLLSGPVPANPMGAA